MSQEAEERKQNIKQPQKGKAVMFSNTKPHIKKREAEPDSDSTIFSKSQIVNTNSAKSKFSGTDKWFQSNSTVRLYLALDNSWLPLDQESLENLDIANRKNVWIQRGDGPPKLLHPPTREKSESPLKQTKMDIYMEPKIKAEQIKNPTKTDDKKEKNVTKTPETSDDDDEVRFVSVRSAGCAIDNKSYMTYWKEQYIKLKIQPSTPPVCMKDLQRIPMDHPKLKFGTSMDAIGVYSAEIDCIQYLNDAFDIMRRNQIPWLNALTYLTDYKSYNKKLQPTIRCAQ